MTHDPPSPSPLDPGPGALTSLDDDAPEDFLRALRTSLRVRRSRPFVVSVVRVHRENERESRVDVFAANTVRGTRERLDLEAALGQLFPGIAPPPPIFVVSATGCVLADGQEDVVVGLTLEGGWSGVVAFHRTSLGWRPHSIAAFPDGSVPFIRSLSCGDVNGDGRDEIVLGTRPKGQVIVLSRPPMDSTTAEGDTGFSVEIVDEAAFGAGETNTREVLIADADNDGTPEIVATIARADDHAWTATPGIIAVYAWGPQGWRRRIIDDFGGTSHSRMVAVASLGGLGKNVVVANRVGVHHPETDTIDPYSEMLLYEVGPSTVHRESIAVLERAIKSRGFAIGDVAGDGTCALVVGTRALDIPGHGETSLSVYRPRGGRDSPGGRRWSTETIARTGPVGFHCVATIDTDGDGSNEIIASDDESGLIHEYALRDGRWSRKVVERYPGRILVTSIHPTHRHGNRGATP